MGRYEVTEADQEGKRAASQLISRVYRESGYVSDGENLPGVSSYLTLPTTTTLLAMKEGELAGTLSLFFDGDKKLPMDAIFASELAALRAKNLRLVEMGQFAVAKDGGSHGIGVALSPSLLLFKEAFRISLKRKADVICIAVNPKHEKFYRLLGFTAWEGVRDYPSVNNAPAMGMYLYTADAAHRNLRGMLVGKFLD